MSKGRVNYVKSTESKIKKLLKRKNLEQRQIDREKDLHTSLESSSSKDDQND